jgi:hypothetical protein
MSTVRPGIRHGPIPYGFHLGQVKWYDADKKYGFISPLDGGPDVFVYVSAIRPRHVLNTHRDPSLTINNAKLITGEYVVYQQERPETAGDRAKAVNVSGLYDADGNPGSLICDYGQVRFDSYTRRQFDDVVDEPPVRVVRIDAPLRPISIVTGKQPTDARDDCGRGSSESPEDSSRFFASPVSFATP